jgi:hypothetical protein
MKSTVIFFLLVLFLALPAANVAGRDKSHIGWVENVKIYPGGREFKAKIDTGARNSSLHATNIVEFEREGNTWVRFEIIDKKQEHSTIELPLVREATIKRHFGRKQQRHVVVLGICLGKVYKETEVTLVDRGGFLYELLIGRSYLRKNFVVDPAAQFTVDPGCKVPEKN